MVTKKELVKKYLKVHRQFKEYRYIRIFQMLTVTLSGILSIWWDEAIICGVLFYYFDELLLLKLQPYKDLKEIFDRELYTSPEAVQAIAEANSNR